MQVKTTARPRGVTTEQIKALRPGSIFIVHTADFAGYCRHIVASLHRDAKAIRVIAVQSHFDVQKLRGLSAPDVVMDHKYLDLIRRPAPWVDELFDVMASIRRAPVGRENA